MGNIRGYIRVSTEKQSDNNSFAVQEKTINDKYSNAKIYSEAFTATKQGVRPVFEGLLEELIDGDTLVIAKMDRFARTVREGLEVVDTLLKRGVVIDILNLGKLDNTPMGRLLFTVLLAFAEFEASQIKERCMLGKEKARENPDFRDGRPPKFSKKQIEHALGLLDDGNSYKKVSELTGISVSTLTRARRNRKVTIVS